MFRSRGSRPLSQPYRRAARRQSDRRGNDKREVRKRWGGGRER